MAHDEDLLEPFQGEDCWDDSLEQAYEDRFYAPEMEVDYSLYAWDGEDSWEDCGSNCPLCNPGVDPDNAPGPDPTPFEVVGVLLVEVD